MPTTYTVAVYNLKVGNAAHRKRQAQYLARYGDQHGIDIWLLCEAIGYGAELRSLTGYQAFHFRRWAHSDNTAILVRRGIPTVDPWLIRMARTWPRPRFPGTHPARTFATVRVPGFARLAAIHFPSVKGASEGKGQRVAAYIESGNRLVTFAENVDPKVPLLIGGDWNEGAGEAGTWKPKAIAARAGLRSWSKGGIDYPMTRGLVVSDMVEDRRDKGHTDHGYVLRFKATAPGVVPEPEPDPEPVPEPEPEPDMAGWCPFAAKREIPPGSTDPRIEPRLAILHVDAGNAESLYEFFRDRGGGIESHFHVKKDGTCVTPETRVLTRDLRWEPVGNLAVGDRILAFDESRPRRCYREAVVEWVERQMEETYAVVLDDESVIYTTADHRWLCRSGKSLTWRRTMSGIRPLTGATVPVLVQPWDRPSSYAAGWMGGLLDGEGCINRKHLKVSFAQRPTTTLDRARDWLKSEGFEFHDSLIKVSADCRTIGITGGAPEQLRLLGTTRPERLIENFAPESMGMIQTTQLRSREVVAVYPVGQREIVKMQTSTRTFIAEGYGMHNCEQYRSIYYQADANYHANDFAVSIETQGFGAGEWTGPQVTAIKALLQWLNTEAGIPLRKATDWDGSGVGYHTMFGSPSHWTPVAKSCPGPDRIKQFYDVLVPWMEGSDMPLNDADKAWIRETVEGVVRDALSKQSLDVGKPNPWGDDKVAEVVLNTLARIEANTKK